MLKDNSLIRDLAKLSSSVFATAAGAKDEIVTLIRQQLKFVISDMNFVTREEFEVVKRIALENKIRLDKLVQCEETPNEPRPNDDVCEEEITKHNKDLEC